MIKTKVLGCDIGFNGTPNYSGVGLSCWEFNIDGSPNPLFEQYCDLPYQYHKIGATAGALRPIPALLGSQIFVSTRRPRPSFNALSNRKLRAVMYSHGGNSITKTGTKGRYVSVTPYPRTAFPTGLTLEQVTINSPPDFSIWDDAQRRAYWSMQPRFEGEFSALNFLYELKDFKSIMRAIGRKPLKPWTTLKPAWKEFCRLSKKGIQSVKDAAYDTFNASTKVASEVLLTKNFAIDPTVRDLTTLHAQLATLIDNVQQEFFERGESNQISHFSETRPDVVSLGTTTNYVGRVSGVYESKTFTATLEYRYNYKMRTRLNALKRYYGLEPNALVLWNALPFSFLVDYWVGMGDAINSMSTDPNVQVITTQYCESIIASRQAGTFIKKVPSPIGGFDGTVGQIVNGQMVGNTPRLQAGVEGTWYVRRLASPNKGAALPKVRTPSFMQGANMLALLRCMW